MHLRISNTGKQQAARLEYYSTRVSKAAVTDGLLVRNSISGGAAVCQKKYRFIVSKATVNF